MINNTAFHRKSINIKYCYKRSSPILMETLKTNSRLNDFLELKIAYDTFS